MKRHFSFLRPDQVGEGESFARTYSKDSWTKATFLEARGEWKNQAGLVLFPEREDEVVRIVQACVRQKLSFLPYGGGSGVCGAAIPEPGQVVIDCKRMDRVLSLDPISHTVEVESGLLGVDLETYLNQKGFTLGHFPSSMNAASIGGYLACRSAGQCSSRYGKIEDMVLGMRVVLPTGKIIALPQAPRHAMGPDFLQLFTGAEGTLGVITSARFLVRRLPASRRFLAFSFPSVKSGLWFMREALQRQLRPAIFRLYDPLDSLVFQMTYRKKKSKKKKFSVQKLFLSYPFFFQRLLPLAKRSRTILIAILEGDRGEIQFTETALSNLLPKTQGKSEPEQLASSFYAHRFGVNFFLPQAMARGYLADTCEVVSFWRELEGVYQSVLRSCEDLAIVFAHFSHAYESGCCIYFTFLCRLEDYEEVWERMLRACVDAGGSLSHHHGIGKLKKRLLAHYYPDQVYLWEKAKESLAKNEN